MDLKLRQVAKSEVNNVKSLIRDLVRKKITRAEQSEQVQKQAVGNTSTANKWDFAAFQLKLKETIDNITTEMRIAPTSDTVRMIRTLLNDCKAIIPNIQQTDVKIILDELFALAGKIMVKFNNARGYHKAGAGDRKGTEAVNSKMYETRVLAKELIVKFVHDNAIRYLGVDAYPLNQAEAEESLKPITKKEIKYLDERDVDREIMKEAKDAAPLVPPPAETRAEKAFFKQFKSEEDLEYVLTFVAKEDMPAQPYGLLRNTIRYDPVFRARMKKLAFDKARRGNELNRVDEVVAELKPYMVEELRKEEETMGKTVFLNQFKNKDDLNYVLIAMAIDTEADGTPLLEMARNVATNADYRVAMEDVLYKDASKRHTDPQQYIAYYVPRVKKLIREAEAYAQEVGKLEDVFGQQGLAADAFEQEFAAQHEALRAQDRLRRIAAREAAAREAAAREAGAAGAAAEEAPAEEAAAAAPARQFHRAHAVAEITRTAGYTPQKLAEKSGINKASIAMFSNAELSDVLTKLRNGTIVF